MLQRGKSAVKKRTTKPISKGYKVVNPSDFLTDEQDGYTAAYKRKTDKEDLSAYFKKKMRLSGKTKKVA